MQIVKFDDLPYTSLVQCHLVWCGNAAHTTSFDRRRSNSRLRDRVAFSQ